MSTPWVHRVNRADCQKRLYVPPIGQGNPVRASGVGTVVKSKSSKYAEGDKVVGQFAWYDYGIVHESSIPSKAQYVCS